MIGGLARAIAEGYLAPRAAMRRLLDGQHGLEAGLTMLTLAYLIEAMLAVLFGAGPVGLVGHLVNVVQLLFMFVLLSVTIWGVGRLAAGEGSFEGAQLLVGWHALVTSPLSPLAMGIASTAISARSEGEAAPAGIGLMAFLYIGVSFWLMANYVAELHGFRSAWGVLGAIVGLTFAAAILLGSILGAFAPA